jgi:hypothetical protein
MTGPSRAEGVEMLNGLSRADVLVPTNNGDGENNKRKICKAGKRKVKSVRTWKRQARSVCMEGIELTPVSSIKRPRSQSNEESGETEGGRVKKGRWYGTMEVEPTLILAEAAEQPRQEL